MPPAATVHVLLARLADADAALDAARAAVAACRGALGAAAASAASADVEELGANEAPSPVAVRPDQAPVTPETQEPPARSESDAVVQKPAARGTFYWG